MRNGCIIPTERHDALHCLCSSIKYIKMKDWNVYALRSSFKWEIPPLDQFQYCDGILSTVSWETSPCPTTKVSRLRRVCLVWFQMQKHVNEGPYRAQTRNDKWARTSCPGSTLGPSSVCSCRQDLGTRWIQPSNSDMHQRKELFDIEL